MIMKESMTKNQISVGNQMNKLVLLLPLFFLTMCAPAPVTPPAGAFELEIEESQWNYVYDAIEYIKQGQRERKMTDPSDAINSALDDFMEAQYGSDGSTEQEKLL